MKTGRRLPGRPAGTGKPAAEKWRGWQVRFPPADLEELNGSILEKFAAAAAELPDEDLAPVPRDLSEQIDHYVYGTPKWPS